MWRTFRLGGRAPTAASCRDEVVLAALSALGVRSSRQTFTVREVYREMAVQGTSYAEPAVFKTMQRMKEGRSVRPASTWSGSAGRASGL